MTERTAYNCIPAKTMKRSRIFGLFIMACWLIFQLLNPSQGYNLTLQLLAVIASYPIFRLFILLFVTKKIALGIFFLTLYQTWNMFLSPYLGAEQVTASMRTVKDSSLLPMCLFCTLSIYALYFGFMFGYKRIKVKPFWIPSFLSAASVRYCLIWSMVGGYLLEMVSSLLGLVGLQISFISSISSMLPSVVGALLVIYFCRGGRNILIIAIALLYLGYSFVMSVGGTLFIYTIILLMGPIVAYVTETGKIPYITIGLIALVLMPVFLNRHQYRNVGLYLSGNEKFALGSKIISENYSEFSLDKISDLKSENEKNEYHDNRFEGVTYLGQIVYCHEDLNFHYQYGKTFIWLPTMFLPRMFVPMRPGQNMGSEWAEYYGIKDPSWNCSMNFPMLVEFYCNFGWLGMVLLSWANGFAIAWVMSLFCYGKGDVNLLLLLFISLKLIVVEANVTLNYGLILQVLFVCWLIKRLKK